MTSSPSASLKQAQQVTREMLTDLVTSSRRMGSQVSTLLDVLSPSSCCGRCGKCHTPCCPPVTCCPPLCLLTIRRRAHAGEIILVPFKIWNSSGTPRDYKIGVRPLIDDRGNAAPSQPTLDKTSVQLQPREARIVEMRMDLTKNYHAGQSFETLIVVREEKYNQNICFTLHIDPSTDIPVAEPLDEDCLEGHFVGWDKHFYCEPRPERLLVGPAEGKS